MRRELFLFVKAYQNLVFGIFSDLPIQYQGNLDIMAEYPLAHRRIMFELIK